MSVQDYLNLITSEHNGKPNFIATVTATVQPLVDTQSALAQLVSDFDLDYAVGAQEDAVGVRVGRSRFLPVALDAYFQLDVEGKGLDQAVLKGPFDPDSGLSRLPDESYRTLLRAVIAANTWDGTIPGAYAAWDILFKDEHFFMLIQDTSYEELGFALVGQIPDAVTLGLFSAGELTLKPAAYTLRHYLPTVYPAAVPGGTPLFGLDAENDQISGLDVGALVTTAFSE